MGLRKHEVSNGRKMGRTVTKPKKKEEIIDEENEVLEDEDNEEIIDNNTDLDSNDEYNDDNDTLDDDNNTSNSDDEYEEETPKPKRNNKSSNRSIKPTKPKKPKKEEIIEEDDEIVDDDKDKDEEEVKPKKNIKSLSNKKSPKPKKEEVIEDIDEDEEEEVEDESDITEMIPEMDILTKDLKVSIMKFSIMEILGDNSITNKEVSEIIDAYENMINIASKKLTTFNIGDIRFVRRPIKGRIFLSKGNPKMHDMSVFLAPHYELKVSGPIREENFDKLRKFDIITKNGKNIIRMNDKSIAITEAYSSKLDNEFFNTKSKTSKANDDEIEDEEVEETKTVKKPTNGKKVVAKSGNKRKVVKPSKKNEEDE